ncbi:MAG: DJ-1/PfpI family protein [Chloroflexota bacterium]
MSKRNDQVFVLWGNQFEEMTAVTFITILREAGLRVKLVSLSPRKNLGSHGIALIPDLTLDQALALASRVNCFIIPYTASGLTHFLRDPRLDQLFQRAKKQQPRMIVGSGNRTDIAELSSFPVKRVVTYPDREQLVAFAEALVRSLLKMR